jgi:hypothetical protein
MPGSAPISASNATYKIVKGKDEKYRVYVKRFFWFWKPLMRYGYGGSEFVMDFRYFSDAQMAMEAHRNLQKEKQRLKKQKVEVEYFY